MPDFDHQLFVISGGAGWFDDLGYMTERHASVNDQPIADADRKFQWQA